MSEGQNQSNTNHKATVLIVEDELFNFIYFSEVLKFHNIQSIKAENGLEAVRKVKENPDIDVILMDIKMPFMDGYQAFTEIRKVAPHIPIIAQTAYALIHERNQILDFGFNDYVAKPVEEETLMEVLYRHI
jgi:CheY-like chemotaxis protein